MSTKPIALFFGYGPRVGAAVVAKLASSGYSIAVVSRKGTGSMTSEGYLSLKADFSEPASIPPVFEAVKQQLKSAPSLVIYNAGAMTPPSDQNSLFSIPATAFNADLNTNVLSPYVTAQEAVKGWESLNNEAPKVFIYTGNILNEQVLPVPAMTTLGVGKSASAYWIGVADQTFSAKGYRFIYADERHTDGKMKGGSLDAEAHAEFYPQIAMNPQNVPWHATFVKGKGYTKF